MSETMAIGTQPTDGYVPGGLKAKAAMVLLGVMALVDLLGIADNLYALLYAFLSNSNIGFPSAGAEAVVGLPDWLIAAFGLGVMAAYLATIVVFLMWFYRAHKNLPALGITGLEYSPGWAIGGFFIPILNLVRPYQVAKEIWDSSDPINHPSHSTTVGQFAAGQSNLVLTWWITFMLSAALGNFAASYESFGVAILSHIASFAAAVLAIIMIKRIERNQATLYELVGSQPH